MNSIKELKEQLGYEEIGLDDIFVFQRAFQVLCKQKKLI